MNTDDLKQIAELLPILAKYPTNYQAKSLTQQIQRLLNNNQSNRFKLMTNTKGGILQPEPKTQSQIIEDKRVSLMDAKKLRDEIVNENTENYDPFIAEEKTKKRTRTKNNDSQIAEENL